MTTDEFPTETAPYFSGHRQMFQLGAVLLAALVVVLVMVWRDNARRATLEQIVLSTAVGDPAYLRLPEPLPAKPYPAIVHLKGQPLYPTSFRRHDKREVDLLPAGRDESAGVNIYQNPPKLRDEGEKDPGPAYFLKLAPGEYLKVKPAQTAAEE